MQHVMILSLMASRLPVAAEQQGHTNNEKTVCSIQKRITPQKGISQDKFALLAGLFPIKAFQFGAKKRGQFALHSRNLQNKIFLFDKVRHFFYF
jgi:hypothetical protein